MDRCFALWESSSARVFELQWGVTLGRALVGLQLMEEVLAWWVWRSLSTAFQGPVWEAWRWLAVASGRASMGWRPLAGSQAALAQKQWVNSPL